MVIRDLIAAFNEIDDKEFSLWICGLVRSTFCEVAAKNDSRIIYWGLVEQNRVFEMQQQATLLVNPRKGDAEFTKYSFPSKTMDIWLQGRQRLCISFQDFLLITKSIWC